MGLLLATLALESLLLLLLLLLLALSPSVPSMQAALPAPLPHLRKLSPERPAGVQAQRSLPVHSAWGTTVVGQLL
jgi:hypothetical protein